MEALQEEIKKEWASKLNEWFVKVTLSSVHRRSWVKYLVAPSGSVMDKECIKAADEHRIQFAHSALPSLNCNEIEEGRIGREKSTISYLQLPVLFIKT